MGQRIPCKITVAPACTCGAARWFQCKCNGDRCEYVADGHPWEIEDIGIPTPHFVEYVAGLHPGCRLIFMPGPSYLAEKYKDALRGTV